MHFFLTLIFPKKINFRVCSKMGKISTLKVLKGEETAIADNSQVESNVAMENTPNKSTALSPVTMILWSFSLQICFLSYKCTLGQLAQ